MDDGKIFFDCNRFFRYIIYRFVIVWIFVFLDEKRLSLDVEAVHVVVGVDLSMRVNADSFAGNFEAIHFARVMVEELDQWTHS